MASLSEVELLDDEHPPAPAAPRRAPRRAWWAVGALVVVAALLVGGQAWLDHRHDAELARFDDVPGVVPPIPATLAVRWTHDRSDHSLRGATQVGSRVVTATVSAKDRSYTVRQVDRADGHAVWSTSAPLDPAVDLVENGDPDELRTAPGECRPLDLGRSPLVACAFTPYGWGSYETVVADETFEPSHGQVVVLDATDGSAVGTTAPVLNRWTAGGGLVVVANPQVAGDEVTWTLTGTDAHGGVTWSTRLPAVPVRPPLTNEDGSAQYGSTLQAAGGRVLFVDQGKGWVLDDGKVTASFDQDPTQSVSLERGRDVVLQDGDLEHVRLLQADGSLVTVAGELVQPDVDDGSDPGVLFVRQPGGSTAAIDATTGRRLSRPLPGAMAPIVLGGRAYVAAGSTIVALDLGSGRPAWREPVGADGFATALVTDGRGMYVVGEELLHGFALADGAPLPDRSIKDFVRTDDDGGYFGVWTSLGMLVSDAPQDALQVIG